MVDITNKLAFQYYENVSNKISNICMPLQQYLGIKCFGYLKIFKNGNYLSLINGFNDYHEKYFKNILEQSSTFIQISKDLKYDSGYFIWPIKQNKYDPIFSLLYEHNIWHGFTIYIRKKDYCETFNFAFNRNCDEKSNFFINNINILKMFSKHFTTVAQDIIDCSDKTKLAVYKNGVDSSFFLNKAIGIKQGQEEFMQCLEKEIHQKIRFSKREIECIKLLCKGKTAKEIGYILDLSYRTIESYIKNAKNKAGCNYKSQLVDTYFKNKSELFI